MKFPMRTRHSRFMSVVGRFPRKSTGVVRPKVRSVIRLLVRSKSSHQSNLPEEYIFMITRGSYSRYSIPPLLFGFLRGTVRIPFDKKRWRTFGSSVRVEGWKEETNRASEQVAETPSEIRQMKSG